MGLELKAVSGLKENKELTLKSRKDHGYIGNTNDKLVMFRDLAHLNNKYPDMALPLKYDDSVYDCEKVRRFTIGSYETYKWFRGTLRLFSKKCAENKFKKLTEFSDCEGVIGTTVSTELYIAFKRCEGIFEDWCIGRFQPSEVDMLMEIYFKFQDAFEVGKEGGAVIFC